MKNLKPIDKTYSYFEEITESKSRDIRNGLKKISSNIKTKYYKYSRLAKNSNLEKLDKSRFSTENNNRLLHCYSSKTNALNKLKADIINNQSSQSKAFCQYCTVRIRENKFDHYVPKTVCPEFSVHPHNLIPTCGPCNEYKWEHWLNGGSRQFLHLYFDEIPKAKILYCNINYIGQNIDVKFELKKNKSISVNSFKIIRSHYEKLHLLELFESQANYEISELKTQFDSIAVKFTKNQVIDSLTYKKKKYLKDFGANYWKACILEALINNSKFISTISI